MFPEWSVDKIGEKVGIIERRIAADDEFVSTMAIRAAENLFNEFKIAADQIDYILLCTQSPDYFLPTTACLVQNALSIPTTAGALDFNLGCSGYVYGLSLAKGLILSGDVNNVLLITSETYSRFIHTEDKSVRTIFGDAASATFIVNNDDSGQVGRFVFGTDGGGAENLIVKAGALRHPLTMDILSEKNADSQNIVPSQKLYMSGADIFTFTLNIVPNLIEQVLKKNRVTMAEIDLFIFHQANKYMLEHLRKKLKIEENKFFISMEYYGNTVSSTIPIALKNALVQNKIQRGHKVLLAGFGVGYSWGATILNY